MEEKKTTFEELLAKDGSFMWRTSGVSMLPLIKTGRDAVVISAVKRPLEKNDVAFFRANGVYVLHRVVRTTENGCVTAGDNNTFSENVAENQILGVMTGLVRRGKNVRLDGPRYKAYVFFWGGRFGLRRVILTPFRALRKRAAKLYRKLKGRK